MNVGDVGCNDFWLLLGRGVINPINSYHSPSLVTYKLWSLYVIHFIPYVAVQIFAALRTPRVWKRGWSTVNMLVSHMDTMQNLVVLGQTVRV